MITEFMMRSPIEEFARFNFGEPGLYEAGIETSRKIRRFDWASFDEVFEKALPILSAIYLIGAIGFSAVLVFNAFVN
jgi:hypothetical protein